jgi:hypothetical protein
LAFWIHECFSCEEEGVKGVAKPMLEGAVRLALTLLFSRSIQLSRCMEILGLGLCPERALDLVALIEQN